MGVLKITLRSDLCAGSGEATGLSVDKDLCFSECGLPFIPARRLKGCLREAANTLQQYGCKEATADNIHKLFGSNVGDEGCLQIRDAKLPGATSMETWLASDLVPSEIRADAGALNIAKLFTYVRGQTRLENGVAVDNSLRYTRVMDRYNALDRSKETCLIAEANVLSDCEDIKRLFEQCCQATRHIGSMRNRGLGNVRMHWTEKAADRACQIEANWADGAQTAERVSIFYTVSLDASVTLPGCAEQSLEIPARSVIGCLASAYPNDKNGSEFRNLFLDGSVRWSSLTPMIGGTRSTPTPLMLVYLKNENTYCNLYSAQNDADGKKQKTLGGTFAVQTENGFLLASISSHTLYHHSHTVDGGLYTQDSLDAGMLYGGVISVPSALAETVCNLLKNAQFAFGRSRSAQYAACGLVDIIVTAEANNRCPASAGEAVYAVLQSDLILTKGGIYDTSPSAVRAEISKALGVTDGKPGSKNDYCLYHTIGGYQQKWQMQKPQIPAVRGGSVYCFEAVDGELPREICMGELTQEGFGVVRVFSQKEMDALTQISRADVDTKENEETDSEQIRALKTALIVASGKRVALEKVNEYYKRHKLEDDKNHGLVGRLRLMLSESESYEDFIARINSIKASDVSSENTTGKGAKARRWVEGLFGDGVFLLNKLFADRSILNLLDGDVKAAEQLKAGWKAPIHTLLHMAYYDKEGGV